MKIPVLLLFCLSLAFAGNAQPERANWYFGYRAGIRFIDDTVVALTDGQMKAYEGCTTISDKQGNLLFYSNGLQVWGRNHQTLPNGSGLLGDRSSTQSALFVPHPGNHQLYYLFTTGATEQGDTAALAYSLIDLRLNNGVGDITVKNQLLMQISTEKLCGVRHANGRDIWVIGHKLNTNAFYTYLVNQNGLVLTPVITNAGTVHDIPNPVPPYTWPNQNAVGYMKASPNGKKIAAAIHYKRLVEIFDFNNSTGELTFYKSIPGDLGFPYSLEFDNGSKKLFIGYDVSQELPNTAGSAIYEYDFDKIGQNSSLDVPLVYDLNTNIFEKALQLGNDNKIYHSRYSYNSLGVIFKIDSLRHSYNDSAIYLAASNPNDRRCLLGLPNFINSYPSSIVHTSGCRNTDVLFYVNQSLISDSVKWILKDAGGDLLSTSSQQSFTYTFPVIGNYKALLIYYQHGEPDTALQTITIHDLPTVNLGADTLLYEGETLDLNIAQSGASYTWQDGSITPNYAITAPGTYQVLLTDKYGCQATDTLRVRYTTIRIPNVFTPNGDGVNDQFVVEGIELHSWQMSIYNRLGKQVFSTDRYANNWAGKDSDAGIYYYSLTNPRLRKHFKGWVEVVR